MSASLLNSLRAAAAEGKRDEVQKLLVQLQGQEKEDVAAKVNTPVGKGGLTALHEASLAGYLEIVKLLLDAGADASCRDRFDQTPLRCAAQNRHVLVVKELLARGASPNVVDKNHMVPLVFAARFDEDEVLDTLLAAPGIDLNLLRSDTKCTALQEAIAHKKRSTVQKLLKAGAQVDNISPAHGTALYTAAQTNQFDTVTDLLSLGAEVNTLCTAAGWSALMIASFEGHLDIVNALLAVKSIQANLYSKQGFTALHKAVNNGHTAVVKALLAHKGIEVTAHTRDTNGPRQTSNRNTPLHVATEMNFPLIAEELLRHGADPNALNRIGQTALHSASLDGNTEVARVLLKHKGTNINLRDLEGVTALRLAAEEGQRNILDLLLSYKADPNVVDHMSISPLNAACHYGHTAVVRSLLEVEGVDKNAVNADRDAPLHCACRQGHHEIVRFLVQHGADTKLVDGDGMSAAQIAGGCGHRKVVAALLGM